MYVCFCSIYIFFNLSLVNQYDPCLFSIITAKYYFFFYLWPFLRYFNTFIFLMYCRLSHDLQTFLNVLMHVDLFSGM